MQGEGSLLLSGLLEKEGNVHPQLTISFQKVEIFNKYYNYDFLNLI